jgi:hypothetical protein
VGQVLALKLAPVKLVGLLLKCIGVKLALPKLCHTFSN